MCAETEDRSMLDLKKIGMREQGGEKKMIKIE